MRSINELPLLVIDNILAYAVSNNRMSARKFFLRYLHLLTVSQIWRAILLPKLYQKAYVMWKPPFKNNDIDTNLDIITSNNCSAFIKKIEICLSNLDCLANFLYRYKTLFKFDKCNWKNVNNISISISQRTLPIPQYLYLNNIEDCPGLSFVELADYLTHYVPNIQHLILNFPEDSKTSKIVYTKLISTYGTKLISLYGLYITSFSESTYLSNLTILSLDLCEGVSSILPRVNSRQLQHLDLKNMSVDFTWDAFYDSNNNPENNIIFENLKTLVLTFTNVDLDEEPQVPSNISSEAELIKYSVHFPDLRTLVLENEFVISSRHTYYFSKKLISATILNSIGGLRILKNLKNNSLHNLRLIYNHIDPTSEAEIYALTGDCIKLCSEKCCTKIRLDVPYFNINWSQIEWQTLKRMEFKTINLNTFIQVLTHCTMLECLILDNILFEDMTGDVYNIPLHTQLFCLKIESITLDKCPVDVADTFIRRILIGLSKLTKFDVNAGQWLDLYDFTRLLGNYYPHLNKLTIKQRVVSN